MTESLLDSPLPIAAAPMAGGPTTLALARAVADAGAFPFLAGGYKTAAALAEEVHQLRSAASSFGVNLFVPSTDVVNAAAFAAYVDELSSEAAAYELDLDPTPLVDDDQWDAKLDLLLDDPVPVVSFTFGLPEASAISSLKKAGSRVLATVTTPQEAVQAQDAGADALIVQGPDAGGHSATFDPERPPKPVSTPPLVRQVLRAVDLPVIGTGGIDGPDAIRDILTAGAQAAAVGTMLLRTDEAGTSPTHKHALGDRAFTETVLTRAFTGRPARALRNGFADRHRDAPIGYPAIHHLTRPLRQAAAAAGDPDRLHLWAGTGWQAAPTGPATDVIRHLTEGA
ncbi:NAD(P)H-dependent flavin oxidoreductase [Microbacterium sp.]|uniref:NAD(P)H-dependent flavin oxidoreductase n=1 Tax=Microbacterium sp. TaxID=51671 RepID=UPI003C7527C6